MTDIHVFNTGRQYTAKGQRIAWKVVGETIDLDLPAFRVVFADVDRGIQGEVLVAHPCDQYVLREYDHTAYKWTRDYELIEELKKAALAI